MFTLSPSHKILLPRNLDHQDMQDYQLVHYINGRIIKSTEQKEQVCLKICFIRWEISIKML